MRLWGNEIAPFYSGYFGTPSANSFTGFLSDRIYRLGECTMILQLHNTQVTPEICLMEFFGKLMMGNDSRQVEWSVKELLEAGIKKIIFDLSRVDSIDSTGVGIIVVCEAKVRKAGGALRIAGAEGIVHDTLMMTHVDRIVPFFSTATEAAQEFSVA
jgi:anti-sigma B factor antagonist